MAEPSDLPEPDAAAGAPHPRHATRLFGHQAALGEFLAAHAAGRLHHAWLITGPAGIGKATLAWKLAAFLLAESQRAGSADAPGLFGEPAPPAFDLDPADPLARRLAALSEPGLLLLRRGPNDKGDQLETQITAKVVRRLKEFFHLSQTGGGRRVVILDPAEEMNPTAANALLKELEEPPKGAVFLIISHQPQRLLPTIRSRCRVLRLAPLGPEDLGAALAQAGADPGADAPLLTALAAGSAGEAMRLAAHDGPAIWRGLAGLLAGAPGFDRPKAMALSEGYAGRANSQRLDMFLSLLELMLGRLALAGIDPARAVPVLPEEAALYARLAPDPGAAQIWANASAGLMARLRHGRAVNLDPASLILDTLLRIDEAASALSSR